MNTTSSTISVPVAASVTNPPIMTIGTMIEQRRETQLRSDAPRQEHLTEHRQRLHDPVDARKDARAIRGVLECRFHQSHLLEVRGTC